MDTEPPVPRYSPALNLATAAFFLAWAAVGWLAYFSNAPLRASLFVGPDPGPALMPIITLTLLTVGGGIILLRALVGFLRGDGGTVEGLPDLRSHTKPILFMISLIVTVALMQRLGFATVGFGFSLVWLFVLSAGGQPLLRRAAVALALAVTITFAIWYGFVEVLRISLPR